MDGTEFAEVSPPSAPEVAADQDPGDEAVRRCQIAVLATVWSGLIDATGAKYAAAGLRGLGRLFNVPSSSFLGDRVFGSSQSLLLGVGQGASPKEQVANGLGGMVPWVGTGLTGVGAYGACFNPK